jgi:NADPH:quinone reductase-like Zn-dependent oxidoreductase
LRAAVYTRYGPPEVVRLAEVARPAPAPDELLISTRATTVNRTDCGVRAAEPFIVRFFTGLRRPRRTILGHEFAGEIEAVGPQVNSFAPGEVVFGLTGDESGVYARSAEGTWLAYRP